MRDLSPGPGAGCRGAAGISEEVEHLERPRGRANPLRHPIPVDGLFGEKAGVLKARGAHIESQIPIGNDPSFRQLAEKFPFAAALLRTVIYRVRPLPKLRRLLRPNGLRVRAAQNHLSPALQLFAPAGIQHLVILPIGRDKHLHSSFSKIRSAASGGIGTAKALSRARIADALPIPLCLGGISFIISGFARGINTDCAKSRFRKSGRPPAGAELCPEFRQIAVLLFFVDKTRTCPRTETLP